jgi:DNA-binding transcriptional regulator of glucitol operon
VIKLVILAGIAWTLQGIMSYLQYRRFQSKLSELAAKYNIGVGYSRNRFGLGAIVIVAANGSGTIERVELMKGISVFAGFKSLKLHVGENVFDEFQQDNSCSGVLFKALREAVENTRKVMGGDVAKTG